MLAAKLFLVAAAVAVTSGAKSDKPSILFIVADDLGYNDVSFQKPSFSVVHTPHLTHLASNGVVFTNHHVQPFCSPTRTSRQRRVPQRLVPGTLHATP